MIRFWVWFGFGLGLGFDFLFFCCCSFCFILSSLLRVRWRQASIEYGTQLRDLGRALHALSEFEEEEIVGSGVVDYGPDEDGDPEPVIPEVDRTTQGGGGCDVDGIVRH